MPSLPAALPQAREPMAPQSSSTVGWPSSFPIHNARPISPFFLRSVRIWPVRDFKDAVSFTPSYRPNCFSNDGIAIKPTSRFHSGFSVRVCSLTYLPICGSWNSERRDVSTSRLALQGLQPAPRSPARQPEAAMCPVSAVYHNEVVLESCLRRGYVPAGGTYALGSLFAPRSYLVVEAGSESMKQALQTTN